MHSLKWGNQTCISTCHHDTYLTFYNHKLFIGYLFSLSHSKPKQIRIHIFKMTAAFSKYFEAIYLILKIIAGFLEIPICIISHNSCLFCKILQKCCSIKNTPPFPLLLLFIKESLATINPLGDPGSIESKPVLSCSFPCFDF